MVKVMDISAEEFKEEVLESSMPVVVEFFTPVCQFCRRFERTFESLAESYDESAKFVRINAVDNRELAMQYDVFGVPTTIIFQGGETVERFSGLVPESQISRVLDMMIR